MAVVVQAPAVTASSKVELHLKCLNLPDMDVMSKSDPQIRVYLSDARTGNREKLIGQTEIIWDNLNPQFSTPIVWTTFLKKCKIYVLNVSTLISTTLI